MCNGMEWGVGNSEGERERERVRCGVWVEKGWSVGHKLDHWSSIYEDSIIQKFIKMNINLIL
jgi:hypothetical protein